MDGTLFWVLATLSAISVGMSKGGLPVVSNLAVPLLALVIDPVVAAGLLLPVYIVSDVVGVWTYRHEFNKRVIVIICAGATVGVAIGGLTASITPKGWVTILVGLIGLVFALNLIWRRNREVPAKAPHTPSGLFWGVLTGFTSFVSHAGGPPYQVWVLPQKLSKLAFAGTSTIAFAYINWIKMIPYVMLGQVNFSSLKIAGFLMVPAAISVLIGARLVRILPDAAFFKIVTGALLLISVKLLWDGFVQI